MNNVNSVIEIGRLTADAELSYTAGGTPCLNFSIAVNESRKDAAGNWQDYANFFEVTLWGKLGESLMPYFTKGRQVAVTGRLHQDRWEKDGRKYSKIKINADNVELLGGKNDGNGSLSAPQNNGFIENIPF